MASVAKSLFAALPAPKQATVEDEPIRQSNGPRIIAAGSAEQSQLILKKTGPPPYGRRQGWKPRTAEDYGDGGAFPEISVAQYPLEMGRKHSGKSGASLALEVNEQGMIKYDAIARQGHNDKRIIHASFKDLIPLRQRADVGEISLERPSEEEVAEQTEKTRLALAKLISGAVTAQKSKAIKGTSRAEPTFVRYTPANQMGDATKKNDRIIKIVERQEDPMEPPKFKHKKIPRGPPSPPAPVMHSPPRKLTAADQEQWKLPPPISNWKNPKGYTVPLDKRLAADGRGLQDVAINDKFAQFSEALYLADRHSREEVQSRAKMQQKLAEKEKQTQMENLRALAQQAREDHKASTTTGRRRASSAASSGSRSPTSSRSKSRSRSSSRSDRGRGGGGGNRRRPSRSRSRSRSSNSDSGEEAIRQREQARRERRKEDERKLRMSRMGNERRIQTLAREQNRDIGEKIALGLASKPTQSAESMYDSRLFNQSSGIGMGSEFNEDQHYDKPLFAAADAARSIYRPRAQEFDDDDNGDGGQGAMDRLAKEKRFDVLGRGVFKGAAEADERDGPVQFEKDTTAAGVDPFAIDAFLEEAKAGSKKKHGLEMPASKTSKRARVDDDDQ